MTRHRDGCSCQACTYYRAGIRPSVIRVSGVAPTSGGLRLAMEQIAETVKAEAPDEWRGGRELPKAVRFEDCTHTRAQAIEWFCRDCRSYLTRDDE